MPKLAHVNFRQLCLLDNYFPFFLRLLPVELLGVGHPELTFRKALQPRGWFPAFLTFGSLPKNQILLAITNECSQQLFRKKRDLKGKI